MIKYLTKYNFRENPNLFSHIELNIDLPKSPPFYVIVSNEEKNCFLGYIEEIEEYYFCRVMSDVFDLESVLFNCEKYNLKGRTDQ